MSKIPFSHRASKTLKGIPLSINSSFIVPGNKKVTTNMSSQSYLWVFFICCSASSFLSILCLDAYLYVSMEFWNKLFHWWKIYTGYHKDTALYIFMKCRYPLKSSQIKTKYRTLESCLSHFCSLSLYYPSTLSTQSGWPMFKPGKIQHKVCWVKLPLPSDMSVIFIHVCRYDSTMCLSLRIVSHFIAFLFCY